MASPSPRWSRFLVAIDTVDAMVLSLWRLRPAAPARLGLRGPRGSGHRCPAASARTDAPVNPTIPRRSEPVEHRKSMPKGRLSQIDRKERAAGYALQDSLGISEVEYSWITGAFQLSI